MALPERTRQGRLTTTAGFQVDAPGEPRHDTFLDAHNGTNLGWCVRHRLPPAHGAVTADARSARIGDLVRPTHREGVTERARRWSPRPPGGRRRRLCRGASLSHSGCWLVIELPPAARGVSYGDERRQLPNGRDSAQGELKGLLYQLAGSAWAVRSAVGSNRGSNGTRPGSESGRNPRLARKDPVRQPTLDKSREVPAAAPGRRRRAGICLPRPRAPVRDSTGPPRASR
jgi:hypothetical protein